MVNVDRKKTVIEEDIYGPPILKKEVQAAIKKMEQKRYRP